jgi:hypothetical protein
MRCPQCGGQDHDEISPNRFRCMTQRLVGAVPPGVGGNATPTPIPLYERCGAVFDLAAGQRAEAEVLKAVARADRDRQAREAADEQRRERISHATQDLAEWLSSINEVEERLLVAATHLTSPAPSGGAHDVSPPRLLWPCPDVVLHAFPELLTPEVKGFIKYVFGTTPGACAPIDTERLARWFQDRATANGLPPKDRYTERRSRKTWWSGRMKEVAARPVAAWKIPGAYDFAQMHGGRFLEVDDGYVLAHPNKHGKVATVWCWNVFHVQTMGRLLKVPSPPGEIVDTLKKLGVQIRR